LTFKNISFATTGNLMNLGHQFNTQVVIQNSRFEQINFGRIVIESSSQEGVTTKVQLTDSYVDSFDSSSHSFISAFEGAELQINN
jgi:hypothetical protein